MSWPWAPMLNTPVLNPMATPTPARMSGVAETSVSEIGVNTAVQPCPVETAWLTAEGLKIDPVNIAE